MEKKNSNNEVMLLTSQSVAELTAYMILQKQLMNVNEDENEGDESSNVFVMLLKFLNLLQDDVLSPHSGMTVLEEALDILLHLRTVLPETISKQLSELEVELMIQAVHVWCLANKFIAADAVRKRVWNKCNEDQKLYKKEVDKMVKARSSKHADLRKYSDFLDRAKNVLSLCFLELPKPFLLQFHEKLVKYRSDKNLSPEQLLASSTHPASAEKKKLTEDEVAAVAKQLGAKTTALTAPSADEKEAFQKKLAHIRQNAADYRKRVPGVARSNVQSRFLQSSEAAELCELWGMKEEGGAVEEGGARPVKDAQAMDRLRRVLHMDSPTVADGQVLDRAAELLEFIPVDNGRPSRTATSPRAAAAAASRAATVSRAAASPTQSPTKANGATKRKRVTGKLSAAMTREDKRLASGDSSEEEEELEPVDDTSNASNGAANGGGGRSKLRRKALQSPPIYNSPARNLEESSDDERDSSPERDNDKPSSKRKRLRWSDAEMADLYRGMQRYGSVSVNRWQTIKQDVSLKQLRGRTNVDLKDKWRWLEKHTDEIKRIAKIAGKS